MSISNGVLIATGYHFPDQSTDSRAAFNRVLMYDLQSDNDDYEDDNDRDQLRQDRDY